MKKVFITLFFFVGFLFLANTVSAKGVIVYSNGPKFEKHQELPDSITIDGTHVNFGVAYEQFSIFWIPMWNYGEVQYAAITDDGNTAYFLEEDELLFLKEEYGIDTDKKPKISFWNKVGGKIIWIIVLLLIIWGFTGKSKDDDENTEEEEPEDETSMTQEEAAIESAEEEDIDPEEIEIDAEETAEKEKEEE